MSSESSKHRERESLDPNPAANRGAVSRLSCSADGGIIGRQHCFATEETPFHVSGQLSEGLREEPSIVNTASIGQNTLHAAFAAIEYFSCWRDEAELIMLLCEQQRCRP